MKTINLSVLFLILFITLSSTSCEKDENEVKYDVLIPLKTGNQWTYENHRGNELNSVVIEVGEFVNINGNKGYKYSSGSRPHNSMFIVNNDVNGDFIVIGGYSEVDSLFLPSVNYKLNAVKGESWDFENVYVNYDSGIFRSNLIKVYCIETDTMITTSMGTFECILYEHSRNSGEDVFRDYVSINTGLIKSEHFENNHLFSYMILTDYELVE